MTANTLFSLKSGELTLEIHSRPVDLNPIYGGGDAQKSHTHPVPVVGLILFCPETDRVALFQRGPDQSGAGEWEFPGGKIEAGETYAQGLVREIQEELGLTLDLSVVEYCGTVIHAYPRKTVQIWFFKYPFFSKKTADLRLTDHKDVTWIKRSQLGEYPLSAADQKYVDSRFAT